MKRIAIIVCVFALVSSVSAQTKANNEGRARIEKMGSASDPKFLSDEVSFDDVSKITTLTGNVSLKTEKFEFEGARKVVYDSKSKTMTVYDFKKFAFGGTVVLKDKSSKANVAEYTLEADKLYLL